MCKVLDACQPLLYKLSEDELAGWLFERWLLERAIERGVSQGGRYSEEAARAEVALEEHKLLLWELCQK